MCILKLILEFQRKKINNMSTNNIIYQEIANNASASEKRIRLEELEEQIWESSVCTLLYLMNFPKAILEYDVRKFDSQDPNMCYRLSILLSTDRVPELEYRISRSPQYAVEYAEQRLKLVSWADIGMPDVLDIIGSDPEWALRYTKNCLKKKSYKSLGRDDIEEKILGIPDLAVEYSYHILDKNYRDYGRADIEEKIFTENKATFNYCYLVLGRRAPKDVEDRFLEGGYYGYLYKKYLMPKE